MDNRPKITASYLRPLAANRWLDIFQALCPGMFDEAIKNLGTHVTCPFHGGVDDFRFIKKSKKGGTTNETGVAMCTCGSYTDGFATIQRATGWEFKEVLKEINAYLNGSAVNVMPIVPRIQAPTKEQDEEEAAEILSKIKNLFAGGKPFHTLETPYYEERGLSPRILEDLSADIRTISSLGHYHYDKAEAKLKKLGSFPAILAMMRSSTDEPVAVHRTWLSRDRKSKAPVPKPKKLSEANDVKGAAIRLFEAKGADTLGLTEGVETGIAVRQLATGRYWPEFGKIPVWACYAERNIRSFEPPAWLLETLRTIVVFADNDESGTGLAAALEFQCRMALEYPDIDVIIKLPAVVGCDWADVLENIWDGTWDSMLSAIKAAAKAEAAEMA